MNYNTAFNSSYFANYIEIFIVFSQIGREKSGFGDHTEAYLHESEMAEGVDACAIKQCGGQNLGGQ